MCGIFGLALRSGEINKEVFTEQLNTLHSRGPDSHGVYFDQKVGLGFRRLAIIDLSPAGNQPMHTKDESLSIVYNGEIYNYLDLKSKLTSYNFHSKSDTEVLLAAHQAWGTAMFTQLEGMFGLCIYDKTTQQLILARDHFGKKPLYYYKDQDVFYFSSELKALLKDKNLKSKFKLSESSLLKYLFFGFIPSPHTIFENVHKLEPASYLVFDLKTWEITTKEKFWDLSTISIAEPASKSEVLATTEHMLRQSVKKRLMSDVPLGVFLSGGLDSSLITKYLSDYSPSVDSFTIAYKNSPEADEANFAQIVANQTGVTANMCNFEEADVLQDFVEISNYMDEPFVDAAIVPLYHVAKFAKPKITVVLSGDGGDEIFGGYPKYMVQNLIQQHNYLKYLTNFAKKYVAKSDQVFKMLEGFEYSFEKRQYFFGTGSFYLEDLASLVKTDSINEDVLFADIFKASSKYTSTDWVNKSMYIDTQVQLPDWYLVKGDRATMAASLEMRNPMLDKHLAEYMFSLPGSYKTQHGQPKYVLKQLALKYFARDFVHRQKSGFGVPLDKWIRSELNALFQEYLFVDHGYFDLAVVHDLYNAHMHERVDNRFTLLRIFNFNYWYKNYYE